MFISVYIFFRSAGPRYCRAMFSYQQANPDELSLAVGDIIQVLGEEEEGWWRGQKGTIRGVFPSNFVIPLEPVTAPPPILPPKPSKYTINCIKFLTRNRNLKKIYF